MRRPAVQRVVRRDGMDGKCEETHTATWQRVRLRQLIRVDRVVRNSGPDSDRRGVEWSKSRTLLAHKLPTPVHLTQRCRPAAPLTPLVVRRHSSRPRHSLCALHKKSLNSVGMICISPTSTRGNHQAARGRRPHSRGYSSESTPQSTNIQQDSISLRNDRRLPRASRWRSPLPLRR